MCVYSPVQSIFDMTYSEIELLLERCRTVASSSYRTRKNPDTSTARRTGQPRGYMLSNLGTWRLSVNSGKTPRCTSHPHEFVQICIIKFNCYDSGRHPL